MSKLKLEVRMRIFQMQIDFGSEGGLTYGSVPIGEKRQAPRMGEWSQGTLQFTADGRFAPGEVDKLNKNWVVINSDNSNGFNIIGDFTHFVAMPPCVNKALRAALERCAPGAIEFATVNSVWNLRRDEEVGGGPYYFANVYQRHDTWDDSVMEIEERTRTDGSVYETIMTPLCAVRKQAVSGLTIWRERRTNHVLMSENVKFSLEDVGVQGYSFCEVQVTG